MVLLLLFCAVDIEIYSFLRFVRQLASGSWHFVKPWHPLSPDLDSLS
jgi:hypothetical protein